MSARRSGLDAVVYGLVAATIGLALLGPPLMSAVDPRLAVSIDYHVERAATDPWGTPWVHLNGRPWSVGPDRLADEGGNDDVPVLDERDDWLQLYRGAGEGLFGLAVLLAVMWELCRALAGQLRAPRGELAAEAGRAAAIGLPVSAVVLLLLAFASKLVPRSGAATLVEELRARMVVPVELAVFGTVYAATAAVLLGARLRAPRATPDEATIEEGGKNTGGADR